MNDDPSAIGIFALLVWVWTVLSLEPAIHPYSVKYAEEVCATNGGWQKIEEGYGPFSSLKCNNGAEFEYEWTDIAVLEENKQ
jgi:hypothetical protein